MTAIVTAPQHPLLRDLVQSGRAVATDEERRAVTRAGTADNETVDAIQRGIVRASS